MAVSTAGDPVALAPPPVLIDIARPRHGWLTHPVTLAGATAALLALAWLLVPTGGDLAAQLAHAGFAGAHPGAAYDLRWYGGFYPAAYSVLAPAVLALTGVAFGSAIGTVIAAMLAAVLLVRAGARRAQAGAVLVAVTMAANLASGRATFALAAAVGFGALLALPDSTSRAPGRRRVGAALLSVVATLTSPVAGLFLGLAAVALLLTGRGADGWWLGAGAALPLTAVPLLFAQGGMQPMSWDLAVAGFAATAAVGLLLPRDQPALRVGCLLYAVGILAAYTIATPVGSNVDRLGLLLALPVLVAFTRVRLVWLTPVLIGLVTWSGHPALADFVHRQTFDPSYDAGLRSELASLHANLGRVEAVPQRQHWEVAALAGDVSLARGWERQLDVTRNPLFYAGPLTPATYHAWLLDRAVSYVALADREPDGSSAKGEAELLRRGQPWLHPVWHDSHWQLWQVVGARPMVTLPARVDAATASTLTLTTPHPADVELRVHWSPWLTLTGGPGCLYQRGDWTGVRLRKAGSYQVSGRYTLPRGSPC